MAAQSKVQAATTLLTIALLGASCGSPARQGTSEPGQPADRTIESEPILEVDPNLSPETAAAETDESLGISDFDVAPSEGVRRVEHSSSPDLDIVAPLSVDPDQGGAVAIPATPLTVD